MDRHRLFESVPNFSEGSRADVIAELTGAASRAHVLDVDPDAEHNRVVISLAGHGQNLLDALVAFAQVATERIDLREHRGVHPRVGATDVIPIVPFGDASLADARDLARELGERIWKEVGVPIYFYGHGENQTLADIRAGRAQPSLGGPDPHQSAGAVCVGARRPLLAFNVLLPGMDPAAARALARSLRETRGGLRGVQALVFELPGRRVQLSMNLFRLDDTPPSAVVAELERRGVRIGAQQVIGLCPAAVANEAAAGRLLEARLAAAAARRGAELSIQHGDDEHARLAGRLEREADKLAHTGIEQSELLAAAERTAALVPVLGAAGVLGEELHAMLDVAARGLRAALSDETRALYSARIDALDRRVGAPGD
ncbi:MAG TPA: glutamate formiminotransferase [Candidatus Dormibacteraeota bacterium]|nr:glutamate formiminotransferase [Candidatus Dormibacteraeota bacterium]